MRAIEFRPGQRAMSLIEQRLRAYRIGPGAFYRVKQLSPQAESRAEAARQLMGLRWRVRTVRR